MGSITQLRSRGRLLAKRWACAPDGAFVGASYDKARDFTVVEHTVGSLDDVAGVLGKLQGDRFSCVIRGAPNASCNQARTRRLGAHFDDAAQPWSLHDFDLDDCPADVDWRRDPGAAAGYARSLMPPEFHSAACVWSFTGSQGFKSGLRIRLAFWHDVPLTCADLKSWLGETVPEADRPRGAPSCSGWWPWASPRPWPA